MTTESRSQCSRCRGCTSSTRLRGRHRRRSHLMYHLRTSPCIHRARRSRTCTNRRGDSCEGWAEARGPSRGPSTRAGRDMAARADLRPVSGCDSCVRCCGPEKVPNSAAAARNGQSGMCTRHRDEDESSSIFGGASHWRVRRPLGAAAAVKHTTSARLSAAAGGLRWGRESSRSAPLG